MDLKNQYNRFPYPPIPFFALPKKNQGFPLSYELGTKFVFHQSKSHRGIKILIVGGGTFEPLLVAQTHPQAKLVCNIDFSESSCETLKKRILFAKLTKKKLPPIEVICHDINHWHGKKFDYILISNVLHHLPDPTKTLTLLSTWLKPDGVLRMITYPKTSRIWMRETQAWFKCHNLKPADFFLKQKSKKIINTLPENHPIQSCYYSQPERGFKAGLIDSFYNAFENPLTPLEWQEAFAHSGLKWMQETQNETSQGSFLTQISRNTKTLSPFERMQIMDDSLEVCSNPIWWLRKESSKQPLNTNTDIFTRPLYSSQINVLDLNNSPAEVFQVIKHNPETQFTLPSQVFWELGEGLYRCKMILNKASVSLDEYLSQLRSQVGPRYSAPPHSKHLPKLSVLDYDTDELLKTYENYSKPWSIAQWTELAQMLNGNHSIVNQAERLQRKEGPFESMFNICFTVDGSISKVI